MLSKQQKIRYGQILRQQMKEKQQRKKMQDYQKRGQNRNIQQQINQNYSYNNNQIQGYPTNFIEKQNTYNQLYQNNNPQIYPHNNPQIIDPKQQLQRKFESPQYNYFGGLGVRNINKKNNNVSFNDNNRSLSNNNRLPAQQVSQFNNGRNNINYQFNPRAELNRIKTQEDQQIYYNQNQFNNILNNQNQSISPPTLNNGNYNQRIIPQQHIYHPPQHQKIDPLGSIKINYNSHQQKNQLDNRGPISYEFIQEHGINSYQGNQINRLNPYQQNNQNSYIPSINQHFIPQNLNQISNNNSYQIRQPSSPNKNNLIKQNQQLMEVYRKGGRNLLKLQNQTIDQHLIKQKRKLQIQKQLKQQIQQAQHRKKAEIQKQKRQQQEQQRKQLAYLAQQKRKIQQQQKKKMEQRQRAIEQNVRNVQRKKQMQQQAKKKVLLQQRNRLQKKKRQVQMQKNKQQQQRIQLAKNNQLIKNKNIQPNLSNQSNDQIFNKLRSYDDDSVSVVSSQISTLEKGYSTNLAKQFFTKQKQKVNPSDRNSKKFEHITYQVQKMQQQIRKQGQIFNKQMMKIKQDSQRALIQKRKAQQQIQRLQKQLKRKMNEDNQKLLRALQSNDYNNQNNYHLTPIAYNKNNQYSQGYNLNQLQINQNTINPKSYKNLSHYQQDQIQYNNKKPLRQKQSQKLVKRQYQIYRFNSKQQQNQSLNQSIAGLVSLDGTSKHIPINLPYNQNLTISQIQNFAKDSSYFQKTSSINKKISKNSQKINNKISQIIPQQDNQQRDYVSRKSNRNVSNKNINSQKDQLDKLIQSRAKSRGGWGQMSSVNSDITKQIQQLLRKKQDKIQRPSSRISNAGKQSLAHQGFSYDALTLNSNIGGKNGTIDLQMINGRNEDRLKQLRNLGIQTINTNNGDDDIDRLDILVNKYRQIN